MKALFCLSTIAIISAAYAEADRPIGHIDLRLTKSAETESAPVKNMLASKLSPLPTFVSSKQTVETEQERRDRLERESNTGATFLFTLEEGALKPVVGISYDFPGKLDFSSGLLRAFQLTGGYVKLTVLNGLGTSTTEGQSASGFGIGFTSATSDKGKTASFFIGGWAPNYNVSKGTLLIGFKF
jgi:hypothetical protein